MAIEHRVFTLGTTAIRSKNGKSVFRGHAAIFNKLSENLGGFREVIAPGAFARVLDEGQDVRFLINHDPNLLLARTNAGTLTLKEDSKGLAVEAELADTTYGRDLTVLLERRDISEMSFGFAVKRDSWRTVNGEQIRTLEDVDLFDVSAVTFPAYPQTDADMEARMIESVLREARAGKVLSTKNREALSSVIEALSAIEEAEPSEKEENALNRKLALTLRERDFNFSRRR